MSTKGVPTGGSDGGGVIVAQQLIKDYRRSRQRPGLLGALRGLVSRDVEEHRALDRLDLRVEPGEFVGLLGRNGAGKTTTIKLCCGLLRPSAGEVRVLGHQPWRREFAFLRRIAVVLGNKAMLWWDVSPMDSYLVHRAMYDLDHDDFARRVAGLAELLDVTTVLDVPVRQLSLGQRMKCELLAALLHRPEVLFLDEPTIGLDVVSTAAVREFLAEVNRRDRTTIVLTSHDMDDVEQLCDRVLLVDDGRLGYDGTVADLVARTSPDKELRLTFRHPPQLPAVWPRGTRMVGREGTSVELRAERDAVPALLGAAAGWGELVDLDVGDADLDQVMRDVLAGR
ncbi:ABC-2 type transport system ATP-binding protein [Friedmanniella endophytica]|uniref:ABC-2 type transport system ATP-binding protein n=1 Tax=Microlunatus kandeliicorticis TaxID=1759536 RepID=A0A7W3IU72_9ACTN|nr:ATP-binding cassette domain-containing protein [Microlunatus kandeliicorticis]MBA8795341.1 ABC-2 type transport system ATP-binding protein [Microlunatus kandeliicorticis]